MTLREPLVQATFAPAAKRPQGHVVVPRVANRADDEPVAAVRRQEAVLGVAVLGSEQVDQN